MSIKSVMPSSHLILCRPLLLLSLWINCNVFFLILIIAYSGLSLLTIPKKKKKKKSHSKSNYIKSNYIHSKSNYISLPSNTSIINIRIVNTIVNLTYWLQVKANLSDTYTHKHTCIPGRMCHLLTPLNR